MTINEFVAYKQMGELIKDGKLNVSAFLYSAPEKLVRIHESKFKNHHENIKTFDLFG